MQCLAHRLKLLFQKIEVAFQTETTTRPATRFIKRDREEHFPLHLIETGYSKIRIQDAEASVPDDKIRILNFSHNKLMPEAWLATKKDPDDR